MAPQNLLLEISEGRAPRDVEGERKVVQRLADMGVMVAIDDFGFGCSSLANLKELPIHELKIDRSFVTNAIQCKTDSAIVRCIIELGHSLGIRVIAGGVEGEETWRLLSNFGCENAQGYLIARPMPAPEMEKWLRAAGRRASGDLCPHSFRSAPCRPERAQKRGYARLCRRAILDPGSATRKRAP